MVKLVFELVFVAGIVAFTSVFSVMLHGDGDDEVQPQCGVYLVPSTIPGAGRGVVAGRNYTFGEVFGILPSIAQHIRTTETSQLKNYVFGSGHDDFSIIIFGPWNLCNHGNRHTLGRYWADHTDTDPTNLDAPYTVFRHTEYSVHVRRILAGEEVFETYGENWFDRFGGAPSPTNPRQMAMEDLATYGHCLTDVAIRPSTIAGAGNGLYAERDFAPGEVVTVAPTLVLPRRVVDDSAADSVLMNYCLSRPNSDLALFPLNYGPLINHQRGDAVNIKLDWYDWGPAMQAVADKYHKGHGASAGGNAVSDLSLQDNLRRTAQDLWGADFAPLDLAYRAKRPIKKGEELFLDYGEGWQVAWDRYVSTTIEAADGAAEHRKQFRSYIELPESLHQPQWTKQPDTHCARFLIPSTIPGAGRGVVAGRAYPAEEWIEEAVTIVVSSNATDHSQLKNYVFGTGHEGYALIIFGPGNIYNHRKPHTVGRFGNDDEARDPSSQPYPFTDSTVVLYQTLADIGTGDEIYETYGDHWFNRFNEKKQQESDGAEVGSEAKAPRAVAQAKVAAQRMANEDMIQHGICLSDTAVRASTLPEAGRGLFAARDFAPGEVVTVSPVLSLPKDVTDRSLDDNTVLMNYCITDPASDLVLFPLNYGPLINHQRGDAVNIELDWYDWGPAVRALSAKYHNNTGTGAAVQDLTLADKLGQSVEQLYTANFAQLDLAYRATRAIQQGEELFMDYGEAWQAAWDAYLVQLQAWLDTKAVDGVGREEALASDDSTKPLFRAYMTAPEGLFQPHWKTRASQADRSEL